MTDFTKYKSQKRDVQDLNERGIWGERTDVDGAGSIMSVRGTGTLDEELPVVNFGYSFNIDPNSNAEVMMVSWGSDVNGKVAIPIIPRDKQYQWPVGTGGMQHPTDADRRVEFNGDETFLRDGKFVLGTDREVTVTVNGSDVTVDVVGAATVNTGGDVTINSGGSVTINANGAIDLNSSSLTHNGTNVGSTHRHPESIGSITGTPS